jgi:hypothetical protein
MTAMGIAAGCELLERGLGDLEEQIRAVRASVSSVSGRRDGARDAQLEECFANAATYVAGTLTDVSTRLRHLDEVLDEFRRR